METILQGLQGSIAYVLMFEILAITGFLLALLWLRMKRFASVAAAGVDTLVTQSAPSMPVEETPEYKQLNAKFLSLEADYRSSKASKDESEAMGSKVKFLESKLLEYEILQEEIGQLSALKADNERMKAEIVRLQSGQAPVPVAAAPVSVPAPTPVPVAAPVVAPTPVAEPAPVLAAVPEVAGSAEATVDNSAQAEIDALMAEMKGIKAEGAPPPKAVVIPPAAAQVSTAQEALDSPSQKELDNLLADIDALAGDSKAKNPPAK